MDWTHLSSSGGTRCPWLPTNISRVRFCDSRMSAFSGLTSGGGSSCAAAAGGAAGAMLAGCLAVQPLLATAATQGSQKVCLPLDAATREAAKRNLWSTVVTNDCAFPHKQRLSHKTCSSLAGSQQTG